MTKYKYRIKTEEEFLEDFGNKWRDAVEYTFPEDMDYLLNTILDEKLYEKYLVNGRINLEESYKIYIDVSNHTFIGISDYTITAGMIKEIRATPEYNEVKKLIYD